MTRLAYVQTTTEGRQQVVEVIGETPKRFRIRAIAHTELPGRQLSPGDETLVFKHLIAEVLSPRRPNA